MAVKAGHLADAVALVHFYVGLNLGAAARAALDGGDVAIATTTVWELAIRTAAGKLPDLRLPGASSLSAMFRGQGFSLIDLTPEMAEAAASLPLHHRDPFDRALVATAIATGRVVLTNDAVFAAYGIETSW